MSIGIEAAGRSETQRQIVDLVREFARTHIEPHAAEWDRTRHFPRDVIDELGKLGFLGLTTPEAYDGMGLDTATYALAVEVLAGVAVSEPDAGSDVAALSTRAVKQGGEWVLDGTKAWVSHGAAADVVVVLAQSEAGISAFLVPTDAAGYRPGAPVDTMGLKDTGTVPVVLEHLGLPADHLLGQEGHGLDYVVEASDTGRLGLAVLAVGIARRALEHTLAYCGERRQFGKALREFEAVQFKLADMATRVEAARALAHAAAARRDRGEDASSHVSMAKLFASEAAMWVTTQAVQLFGGYGYMRDFPVEKLFRDAKATEIHEGTSEIQRLAVARGLAAGR